jgi:hypothetical protein
MASLLEVEKAVAWGNSALATLLMAVTGSPSAEILRIILCRARSSSSTSKCNVSARISKYPWTAVVARVR